MHRADKSESGRIDQRLFCVEDKSVFDIRIQNPAENKIMS